jgi:hypothetical protein
MKLWIDDERPMPDGYSEHATSSAAAIQLIDDARLSLTLVSFDHDLGGDDTTRPVMLWMIDHDVWPDTIRFHTANPIGREWLVGMADRYAPAETHLDLTNPHAVRGFENYG